MSAPPADSGRNDIDAHIESLDTGAAETGSPEGASSADAQGHDAFVPEAGEAGTADSGGTDAATLCGNGALDPGEQCDDGNRYNLDGCDSACNYEVVTRMTLLSLESTLAPAFCTPTTNLIGTRAFTSTALSQLNPNLMTGITNGSTNIFTQFFGLADPSGARGSTGVSIGVLSGQLDPAKGSWPGNNPIDWWFLTDHAAVDANGLPTSNFTNGAVAAGNLTAGPSDVSLPLSLAGSPGVLRVRSAQIAATIDSSPAPNVPPTPPNQLASGITVFQNITADGTGQGLCGNFTVASLAQVPIPQVLTTGVTACSGLCSGSNNYTYCGANNPVGPSCNSLLDALVGGCQASCIAVLINPQQPDVPSGATVQMLTLGAGNKVSSSQTDGNNDAYSAYLKFDANRAHLTGETCAQTSDCQAGKACNNGACL